MLRTRAIIVGGTAVLLAAMAIALSCPARAGLWCEGGGADCKPVTVLITDAEDSKSAKDLIPFVRRHLLRRKVAPALFEPIAAVWYERGAAKAAWDEFISPQAKVVMVGSVGPAQDIVPLATRISTVVYVTRDEELQSIRAAADKAGANVVITSLVQDLSDKYAELIPLMVPTTETVCLIEEGASLHPLQQKLRAKGLRVRQIDVATILRARVATRLTVGCDLLFLPTRDAIFENRHVLMPLLVATGIPCFSERMAYVELGALMAYESDADLPALGMYDAVASVLGGIEARELTDIRAHRYALGINRRAAARLTTPLPPSLLRRVTIWH